MEEMHNIGWFILAYVTFLLVGRVADAVRTVAERLFGVAGLPFLQAAVRACGLTGAAVQGWHNMYEMLWACNVAMVLAGYGIVTDRPSETTLSIRALSRPPTHLLFYCKRIPDLSGWSAGLAAGLVGATWVMISLDQTLWYIEIACRLYRGKNHPRPWIIVRLRPYYAVSPVLLRPMC
jgi:hypothetical protein